MSEHRIVVSDEPLVVVHETVLSYNPLIAVYGKDPNFLAQSDITAFVFGDARVQVNRESWDVMSHQSTCAVLATLGMTSIEMARKTEKSEYAVKKSLRKVLDSFQAKSRKRSIMAAIMFDRDIYKIARNGTPLDISPAETDVVNLMDQELTNRGIAKKLGKSESTVRDQIVSIGEKTGWRSREIIVLAALLSGQIGNYALEASDVEVESEEYSWLQIDK